MSNPIKAPAPFRALCIAALCIAGLGASDRAAAQTMTRGDTAREQVRVPLTVEGWVKTETARVDIVGDLTLLAGDRAEVRSRALSALAGLVPGTEWRVVRFSQRIDTSGAEHWNFDAFARLKQGAIDGLAAKLDALKKPGQAYRLASIRMAPSLAEVEAARATLRRQIYGLAGREAANAQTLWPGRKVRVMKVDFTGGVVTPLAKIQPMRAALGQTAGDAPVNSPLAVEQRLTVSAVITLMPAPSGPRFGKGR